MDSKTAARPRQPRLWTGLLILAALSCQARSQPATIPEEYRRAGRAALEWTRKFVALGPRPAGSNALQAQQRIIAAALGKLSCRVTEDDFTAATPLGAAAMKNITARFGAADAAGIVVVSGHYDTLRRERFVGANDGGSSAGLLMALAERLDAKPDAAVWVAFLDGEEAVLRWSATDRTYGSRHLAGRWAADGTARRIRALINVDMIGDADLSLVFDRNSDPDLMKRVWSIAAELGYERHFPREIGYIEDDHLSFAAVGIPSIDLIDFNYGPGNAYWHTAADTMDKLSADSFAVILHVLEEIIAAGGSAQDDAAENGCCAQASRNGY